MMKKKKLALKELSVKSFITNEQESNIKGGDGKFVISVVSQRKTLTTEPTGPTGPNSDPQQCESLQPWCSTYYQNSQCTCLVWG